MCYRGCWRTAAILHRENRDSNLHLQVCLWIKGRIPRRCTCPMDLLPCKPRYFGRNCTWMAAASSPLRVVTLWLSRTISCYFACLLLFGYWWCCFWTESHTQIPGSWRQQFLPAHLFLEDVFGLYALSSCEADNLCICVREIMRKGNPLGSPWTLWHLQMKDVAAKYTLCPAARGEENHPCWEGLSTARGSKSKLSQMSLESKWSSPAWEQCTQKRF